MKLTEAFLKRVGDSGLPVGVSEALLDTWRAYTEDKPEDDRLMSVLGFLHLLKQAGIKKELEIKESPESLYSQFRTEEFQDVAASLTKQLQRLHVFDTLRVHKSKFSLDTPIRGDNKTFRFDMCLVPRKSEPLDSALARLRGTLYQDDVPRQLREQYRKLPVNAAGQAKSSLPVYTRVLSNPSTVGFLPVCLDKQAGYSIHVMRVKDGMLVARINVTVPSRCPSWHSPRKHDEFLKGLLQKTLIKIKR